MISRFTGLAVATAMLVPAASFAAIVQCGNDDPTSCNWNAVIGFTNYAVNLMIGLGVLIATILIAWAGLKLVTGRGNPSVVTEAKNMIWNVTVGMAVMILAFLAVKVLLNTFGVKGEFRAPGL